MNNDKQIIVKYIINIDEWVMWNKVYDGLELHLVWLQVLQVVVEEPLK